MFKKTYHNTGENQVSEEHIGGLVIITLFQFMDQVRSKTGNYLAICVLYFLIILFLPNISNKFYHGTGEDQLSAKHKIRTGECCLKENCVSLWISFGIKQGIPCRFFVYIYFKNIMSS